MITELEFNHSLNSNFNLNQNHNHNLNHYLYQHKHTQDALQIKDYSESDVRKSQFGGPLKLKASNVNHTYLHISTASPVLAGRGGKGIRVPGADRIRYSKPI